MGKEKGGAGRVGASRFPMPLAMAMACMAHHPLALSKTQDLVRRALSLKK
jgi:hypothetical protein